jgi:hypothetical protein
LEAEVIAEEPEAAQEASPASAAGGFLDYAEAVADANDWPTISQAISDLQSSPEWAAAPVDMRNTAWRVAFVRLRELTAGGYKFDFITDLRAFRSYIEHEEDVDAIEGNRRAVADGAPWKAASGPAKGTIDNAIARRIETLKAKGAPAAAEDYS